MLDRIIIVRNYLNEVKTRCTYNAAAEALGIKPAEFKKLLDGRSPENSWFVNTGAGEPVGYADDEKHPELSQFFLAQYSHFERPD